MSHKDIRKYFSSLRVVKKWNDLHEEVVEANSIHSFKNRYNRAYEARRMNLASGTLRGEHTYTYSLYHNCHFFSCDSIPSELYNHPYRKTVHHIMDIGLPTGPN